MMTSRDESKNNIYLMIDNTCGDSLLAVNKVDCSLDASLRCGKARVPTGAGDYQEIFAAPISHRHKTTEMINMSRL